MTDSIFPTNTPCIVVGTNGFVWYAPQVVDHGKYIYLYSARTIRQWGTTNGLAELVPGPTKNTVLDAPADVVLSRGALLYLIPCHEWSL